MAKNTVQWDSQILVVFSVLAALAFQQGFGYLARSSLQLDDFILAALVFGIILENWIYLPIYLHVIDVNESLEAALYFLALIAYSCIPFLLAVANVTSLKILEPYQWMLANLILIVLFDSLSKAVTLAKMLRSPLTWFEADHERVILLGTYFFYVFTGVLYLVIMPMIAYESPGLSLWLGIKALVPFLLWTIVRVLDRLIIPRLAERLARAILYRGSGPPAAT